MTDTHALPRLLLMDNGSLRPEAVHALRAAASGLSQRLGRTVLPVSLSHVDRIDTGRLGGEPAHTVDQAITARLASGDRDFLILPLFFGPSRALTDTLPRRLDALRDDWPDLRWRLAELVYPLPGGEPRLAELMVEHLRLAALQAGLSAPPVCLVDHGSPSPRVAEARHHLARAMERMLGQPVAEAAMERRPGAQYDFNGPQLEDWLERQAAAGQSELLLALMFFLPGRHAGAGGDIEAIMERVMQRHPGLRIAATPLVGEHPLLLEILLDRLRDATDRFKLARSDY